MMCYDLVELFLPFIFSCRKAKRFAIIQVPSGRLGRKTNLRSISRKKCLILCLRAHILRSEDVGVLRRKLLMPSFLSLPPFSKTTTQEHSSRLLLLEWKPSPLPLHNDPLIFESNVYPVIFPQDLCRKTARSVPPQNTLGCDKLCSTKCFFWSFIVSSNCFYPANVNQRCIHWLFRFQNLGHRYAVSNGLGQWWG